MSSVKINAPKSYDMCPPLKNIETNLLKKVNVKIHLLHSGIHY